MSLYFFSLHLSLCMNLHQGDLLAFEAGFCIPGSFTLYHTVTSSPTITANLASRNNEDKEGMRPVLGQNCLQSTPVLWDHHRGQWLQGSRILQTRLLCLCTWLTVAGPGLSVQLICLDKDSCPLQTPCLSPQDHGSHWH